MASLKYSADANFQTGTLTSSYTSGGGTMSLTSGHGARFPSTGDFYIRVDSEILKCTARTGDTLTVTGAQDSTSAANHGSGSTVRWVLSAGALTQLRTDIGSMYDTYANIVATSPGSNEVGKMAITSDSLYTARWSGSAWQWFLRGREVSLVPTSGWTSVNIGSSTFTQTNGSGQIYSPTAAGGMRAWERTIPATPYTLEVCISVDSKLTNYYDSGVYVADTGDNKKVLGRIVYDATTFTGGVGVQMTKQSTSTTVPGGSVYAGDNIVLSNQFQWLRIVDNGSTLVFSYSNDGLFWRQIHSVSRTDYLSSPASVGVYLNNNNAVAAWSTFHSFRAS